MKMIKLKLILVQFTEHWKTSNLTFIISIGTKIK